VTFDFDDYVRELLDESLVGAMAKPTPEQRAKLAEDPELRARLSTATLEAVDGVAEVIVTQLRKDTPAMVRDRRGRQEKFEKQLAEHWGRAFAASEAVMKAAFEIGEFHYEKHVPPDGEGSYAFEALARLQARALRIAEEVLVLLKSGYGQAAMARWRSLHEVAVVGGFILEHGDECAERYFAHEQIEDWRAVDEFQKHAQTLGEKPYSDEQMAAAEANRDELLAKYGTRFRGPLWLGSGLRGRQGPELGQEERDVPCDRRERRRRPLPPPLPDSEPRRARQPDGRDPDAGLVALRTRPGAAHRSEPCRTG
jgi:hypothetical protein